MTLVIGGVHHTAGSDRSHRVVQVLVHPLDLPENRIERVLERAVDVGPLGGAQFLEIRVDAFPGLVAAFADPAAEVFDDFLARQDGLGDVIHHGFFGL